MAVTPARKNTLADMVRLGHNLSDSLEKAGREPTTSPDQLTGRNGYNADFLEGWHIALPQPAGDIRPLRRGGPGAELKYQNFSVIMSASRRLPLITAVNIDGAQPRQVPRTDVWCFDGRLDKDDQWGDALYDGNALDRGHMVRREDPVWGTLDEARMANADTFHFTNCCPQMASVNQKVWLGLEDYVLRHARVDRMRVSVFTGPLFGANDLVYRGAQIPKAFWKVVAIVTEDRRPSATAYKIDQVQALAQLRFVYAGYKTFQISIRNVMQSTNIDFSALIPYDGFSQHEVAQGTELIEPLDSFESIRV